MRLPAREFALPTERNQPYAIGSARFIGSGMRRAETRAGIRTAFPAMMHKHDRRVPLSMLPRCRCPRCRLPAARLPPSSSPSAVRLRRHPHGPRLGPPHRPLPPPLIGASRRPTPRLPGPGLRRRRPARTPITRNTGSPSHIIATPIRPIALGLCPIPFTATLPLITCLRVMVTQSRMAAWPALASLSGPFSGSGRASSSCTKGFPFIGASMFIGDPR